MYKNKHTLIASFCIAFVISTSLVGSALGDMTKEEIEKLKQGEERTKDVKLKILKNAAKSRDKNFKFYGKVIDQHGQPITDAIVKISVRRYDPLAEYLTSSKIREPKTDAQGLFELSDKGNGFSIRDIVKIGYEYTYEKNSENHGFDLVHGKKNIGFEKNNPAVYHVRKRGELAYMYTNSFRWSFRSMDNKPKKYAILDGWVDDDGFGHGYESQYRGTKRYPKIIDMSCEFSEDFLRYEIKFEYLGENGGVIADDQALYEAPAEGYAKSVTLKGDMIDHWNESGDRRTPVGKNQEPAYLYVKADDGKYHSRIELKIDTRPDRGNLPEPNCCVSLGCKVFTNPEGTLSLEYDPKYVHKEDIHRRSVGDRRAKLMREAASKKQTFDEKAFIKQIREEEKAEKENQAKQQDKQQSNSKKKFLGLF